jgi:hypothetical protein
MGVPGGRERYYKALYERLTQYVTGAKNHYRCTPVSAVPTDKQPAFIMHVADQLIDQQPRMPGIHLLGAIVELVARSSTNPARAGDAVLNDLLDQVEAALERQPDEAPAPNGETFHTTLGGLVQRCWISDTMVIVSTGEASDQAVALVPVVMEVVGGRRS